MATRHHIYAAVKWLGFLFSLAALVWVIVMHDWAGMLALLLDAKWGYLLLVFPLMLTIFGIRALRWRLLFSRSGRPRLGSSFLALMLGYLFNNILPARAGELIRVHVVGRREMLPRSAALGTVLVERTLELLVLLVILAIVLLNQPLPGWTAHAAQIVAMLALVALSVLVLIGAYGGRVAGVLLSRLNFVPLAIRNRLLAAMASFVDGVVAIKRAPHVGMFLILTAIVWAFEISVTWLVATAFDLQLSPISIVFVMIAIAFGTMVPASPGYIGTFEFFGLSALALLGVSGGPALGFVLVFHAFLFLGSSLVGVACLAYLGWPRLRVEETEIAVVEER